MENLSEGQVLWFVGNELGNFKNQVGEVTVTKVGRKWAELRSKDIPGLSRYRLNVETLVVDGQGYSNPGRCFLSRLDWLNQEGPKLAWMQLRQHLLNPCPDDLSFETIQYAATLLGLEIRLPGQER